MSALAIRRGSSVWRKGHILAFPFLGKAGNAPKNPWREPYTGKPGAARKPGFFRLALGEKSGFNTEKLLFLEELHMKLAEALQERADLNAKIDELRRRLGNNATVQEGEAPAEDPAELVAQLDGCIARLEELIAKINATNCATLTDKGTLTELIARRDCLNIRISAYRDLITDASCLSQRASRTEIKIISAVDVKALQKQADEMAKELRLVDNKIQETNWLTELK